MNIMLEQNSGSNIKSPLMFSKLHITTNDVINLIKWSSTMHVISLLMLSLSLPATFITAFSSFSIIAGGKLPFYGASCLHFSVLYLFDWTFILCNLGVFFPPFMFEGGNTQTYLFLNWICSDLCLEYSSNTQ